MISHTLISTSEGQLALAVVLIAIIGVVQGELPLAEAMQYVIGALSLMKRKRGPMQLKPSQA